MAECVNAFCRLFADDSIIYTEPIEHENDAWMLQQDPDALQQWQKGG